MPSIMQDSQQVAALAEISAALEMVKGLNALLTPGKDGSYQIVFSPEKGRSIKVEMPTKEMCSLIKKQRAKLIKEINTKATKFRIILDDKDQECMKDLFLEDASSEEPNQAEPPVRDEEATDSLEDAAQPASLSEDEELERMIAEEEAQKQEQSFPQ